MNDHLSLGARLHSAVWGNVDGQDNTTNMRSMMPNGREDMQGGFITCLGLGANYTLGMAASLAFEFVKPLYQNYDGYKWNGLDPDPWLAICLVAVSDT